MTARDEIRDILNDHRDYLNPDHLLDEYANEVVQTVARVLRGAWLSDFFAVHEDDGAAESSEFVRAIVFQDGMPRVTDYQSKPRVEWDTDQ